MMLGRGRGRGAPAAAAAAAALLPTSTAAGAPSLPGGLAPRPDRGADFPPSAAAVEEAAADPAQDSDEFDAHADADALVERVMQAYVSLDRGFFSGRSVCVRACV